MHVRVSACTTGYARNAGFTLAEKTSLTPWQVFSAMKAPATNSWKAAQYSVAQRLIFGKELIQKKL